MTFNKQRRQYENKRKEKEVSFGSCKFAELQPPREKLSSKTKMLNVRITFEEALKLNLAIDECIRKLNKLDRRYLEGKDAAINLIVNCDLERVIVTDWYQESK